LPLLLLSWDRWISFSLIILRELSSLKIIIHPNVHYLIFSWFMFAHELMMYLEKLLYLGFKFISVCWACFDFYLMNDLVYLFTKHYHLFDHLPRQNEFVSFLFEMDLKVEWPLTVDQVFCLIIYCSKRFRNFLFFIEFIHLNFTYG